MNWNKIEEHLFERYCVEGEDKELCKLMEEHDKEIRNKEIEKFAEKVKNLIVNYTYPYFDKEGKPVSIWCADGYKCIDNLLKEIAEQMKETKEPFFNFDSPVADVDKKVIRRFADWCYINGIDFSYMSTVKKSGKQFIDDVLERYSKEQDERGGE